MADLLQQLEQANPAQAKELAERTFARLSEAAQAKLKARERPAQPAARETTAQGAIDPNRVYSEKELLAMDGTWKDAVQRQSGYTLENAAASAAEAPALAQSPKDEMPPIPADKKDWFKGREREWRDFYRATGELRDGSAAERAVYMHIFAREGGMAKDGRGSAASGILQKTADRFLGKGNLAHVKPGTPPSELSALDRARVYRRVMDEEFPKIGGHKVLDQVGDIKGATALADGMIRLGHKASAEAIQRAMKRLDPELPEPDKAFGSRSLRAYRRLLADSETRAPLLDAVADEYTNKAPKEKSRWDGLRP